MEKDAFYFPHFCNARHDRKIKRIRKELGLEGYGIFFMLLETLRDQLDFRYPISDIDLLADEFGTSEQKVRCVISNYQLFEVDGEEFFFSPKLISYLEPYLNMKEQRRAAGIKSGQARALISNTPEEEKSDLPQTYVIECYNDEERFIKIGSTNKTISRRFSGHLPYNYTVLRQFFSENNLKLETELSETFSSFKYRPKIVFAGNAECYEYKILKDVMLYKPTTNFSHEHCSSDVRTTHNENEQSKVKESKVNESKETSGDDDKTSIPPMIEWVTEYCNERKNNVIPQKWYDFYQSKNWMIGKNKMKDWQAAIRTWEQSSTDQSKKNTDKPKTSSNWSY